MQQGFSKFSWALALFCLPSALWPLALLVSPGFSDLPQLTETQKNLFSITFWVYPFVLLAIAGVLFRVHKLQPAIGWGLLLASAVGGYGFIVYIIQLTF